tara:strand:+ start:440 stop:628 length:189 start_codon:yes stop_codon:yes gene_type:complete
MAKDACYRKAKAKYRVFPSAYASGYIAKCRKRKGNIKKHGGVMKSKSTACCCNMDRFSKQYD